MRRRHRGNGDLPKFTLERCFDGDDSIGGAVAAMEEATKAADAATASAAATTATPNAAAKNTTPVTLEVAVLVHTAVAAKALTEAAAAAVMAAVVIASRATAAAIRAAARPGTYASCESQGTRRKMARGAARCSRSRGPDALAWTSDIVKAGTPGRLATTRRRWPRRQILRPRTYTSCPSHWHLSRRYRRLCRNGRWRQTGGT